MQKFAFEQLKVFKFQKYFLFATVPFEIFEWKFLNLRLLCKSLHLSIQKFQIVSYLRHNQDFLENFPMEKVCNYFRCTSILLGLSIFIFQTFFSFCKFFYINSRFCVVLLQLLFVWQTKVLGVKQKQLYKVSLTIKNIKLVFLQCKVKPDQELNL